MITCQNMPMAQFADRLQIMSQELGWPVADETGGEGGTPDAGVSSASEPTGVLIIFEAVEKQPGLKLELHKRPMP
jgi:uncharacterized protein (TIGR03435 family)